MNSADNREKIINQETEKKIGLRGHPEASGFNTRNHFGSLTIWDINAKRWTEKHSTTLNKKNGVGLTGANLWALNQTTEKRGERLTITYETQLATTMCLRYGRVRCPH